MKNKLKRLGFLLLCLLPGMGVMGQVTGNWYNDNHPTNGESTWNKPIKHKAAKWFDLRKGLDEAALNMDTFSDTIRMFWDGRDSIQAAHTYVDTIYMRKGTSVVLNLPNQLNNKTSVRSYQRWYNFRTGKTFATDLKGKDQVVDLLTPKDTFVNRFVNGYVGQPVNNYSSNESGKGKDGAYRMDFYFPKDEIFNSYPNNDKLNPDNNTYIVACDVSAYHDYTKTFDRNTSSSANFLPDAIEPTLSHRVIFYIRAVEDETSWYHQALKKAQGDNGVFLETYDIHLPYERVSGEILEELVALSKDARSYVVPEETGTQVQPLDVNITENKAGITLTGTEISGENRVIHFRYPTDIGWGMKRVNGPTATIDVTKTVNGTKYNLVRFNLKFVEKTTPLTQKQVEQLEKGNVSPDVPWAKYNDRTPAYLDKNYRLLTRLNFDYDPSVAAVYGQKEFYPFPLAWTSSSYAFYDGAYGKDFFKTWGYYPEWSYYAIMNDYVECRFYNEAKPVNPGLLPNSTYHLFVDASDRPGTIATIPFREKLCQGSELMVSAWMKSASQIKDGPFLKAPASMLFTILGVREENGKKVYTPIYTHSSGQIPRTDGLTKKLPGTGSGTNEWFQIYFSFINKTELDFDSYALQINNNSASTLGGDMYLDDIRVYIATPAARVRQLAAVCGDRTPLRIQLNWERLLSRTGGEDGSGETAKLYFCFIDRWMYEKYLKEHPNDEAGAIAKAQVIFHGEDFDHEHKTLGLTYKLKYASNKPYVDETIEGGLLKADHSFYYYTDPEHGHRSLAVNLYADLVPNRPYKILLLTEIPEGQELPEPANFCFQNDACAMNTDFMVEGQNVIRVNGSIADPDIPYCAGQMFNFKPEMKIMNGDHEETIENVSFDWFFGTEEEFLEPYGDYGVSPHKALIVFRDLYKEASRIDENTPVSGDFDENMRNLLLFLTTTRPDPEEGEDPTRLNYYLMLNHPELLVTVRLHGLDVVVNPIRMEMDSEGTTSLICWEHIPLELKATGKSPVAHVGFDHLKYPGEEESSGDSVFYEPSLRIALSQIKRSAKPKDDGGLSIRIPLRKAELNESSGSYLGRVVSVSDMNRVFLVGSNDPALEGFFGGEGYTQYDYPVGIIDKIVAEEYKPGGEFKFNYYASIRFDLSKHSEEDTPLEQFVPREGYTYTLMLPFEEKVKRPNLKAAGTVLSDDGSIGNACIGQLVLPMKVVPEYLVWQGGALDNWHDDKNWKRADRERLKKNNSYPTNKENGDGDVVKGAQGFVPLDSTKVIIPEGKGVELYWADFNEAGIWENEDRPDYLKLPTPNIQYDLVTHGDGTWYSLTPGTSSDGNDTTYILADKYKVNVCNQIHFEPNAEMLHAELLYYDTAWIDYRLAHGKWHQLASPLKDVYAGDWYTDKDGEEKSELFKSITYNPTDNSRFEPAVYQRGWTGDARQITTDPETKNMAVSGNWSSVYNDVAVPYRPGTGFSLKPVLADGKDVIIRQPKSDLSYEYEDKPVTRSAGPIEKKKKGLLIVDDFWETPESMTPEPFPIALQQPSEGSPYYLVGNPFTAHLDAETFFSQNTNLQKKYWRVDGNGNQLVAVDGENGWTTTDGKAPLIPPYTSFFVQKAENGGSENTITITPEMQRLQGGGEEPGKPVEPAFTLVARSADGKESRASVCYDISAAAGYKADEDAELFLDSNLSDIPAVYTAAGTMAASVNVTSDLWNIPVGVYSRVPGQVSLTVEGAERLSSAVLYDAETQQTYPLYDGCRLSLPADSHGRYFLRASAPVSVETVKEKASIRYYCLAPGELVVASDGALQEVAVFDLGGRQVYRKTQGGGNQVRLRLPSGNYVLRASNRLERINAKILIR